MFLLPTSPSIRGGFPPFPKSPPLSPSARPWAPLCRPCLSSRGRCSRRPGPSTTMYPPTAVRVLVVTSCRVSTVPLPGPPSSLPSTKERYSMRAAGMNARTKTRTQPHAWFLGQRPPSLGVQSGSCEGNPQLRVDSTPHISPASLQSCWPALSHPLRLLGLLMAGKLEYSKGAARAVPLPHRILPHYFPSLTPAGV